MHTAFDESEVTDMAREILKASAVYGIPADVLSAAIEGKHLRVVENVEVTIGAKSSPTGKDEAQPYAKLEALDAEGMAVLMGGKLEAATPAPTEGKDERTDDQKRSGAADHFNYGLDLNVRQQIRGKLATELEGPSKTIEKAAKALVEAGMHDTVDEARAAVIAQRKAKGLAV
jgi:hypothetical protein